MAIQLANEFNVNSQINVPSHSRFHYREAFWGRYYYNLEHFLDGLVLEERAIAQNVANARTPGYHPVHADFGTYFLDTLRGFNEFRKWSPSDDPFSVGSFGMEFSFDPSFDVYRDELVYNNEPYSEGSPMPPFQPKMVRSPKAGVNLNQEMAKLAKVQLLYNVVTIEDTPSATRYAIDLFR